MKHTFTLLIQKAEFSTGEQARFNTQVINQLRRTNPREEALPGRQRVKYQEHLLSRKKGQNMQHRGTTTNWLHEEGNAQTKYTGEMQVGPIRQLGEGHDK